MVTIKGKVQSTLGTLAAMKQLPTTKRSASDEKQRQRWLDKWLQLKVTHPEIATLQRVVFDFCRDYAKCPGRGRRLVIHGPNGNGKSHTAKAICRWANSVALKLPMVHTETHYRLADSQYINWPGFADHMKAGHWDDVEPLMDVSMLVLDDIGAEHDPSKAAAEKLYLILERRVNKWTVLTTNVRPNDWKVKLEARVASRLLRNCTPISVEHVSDFNSLLPA